MSEATLPDSFLTFDIGGQAYGIDILRVQEIRSYESPTRIANAPAWHKGAINLRGVIVPIVDLRIQLGCEAMCNTFTVVIVLNVKGRIIGAVVDSASDVLEFSPDQVRRVRGDPNPDRLTYTTGVATTDGRQILIMDIESLLCDPAMGLIGSV